MEFVYENSEEIRKHYNIPAEEFERVLISRRDIYLKLFPADTKMVYSAAFGAMVVGPLNKDIFPNHDHIIVIEDSLVDNKYCYDIAQAVIYHELGHINHLHKASVGLDGIININDRELFDRQEIEADMYAVDHGYGKAMLKFLRTLVKINKKYRCLDEDNIKYRIRVLRKTLNDKRLKRCIKTWRV